MFRHPYADVDDRDDDEEVAKGASAPHSHPSPTAGERVGHPAGVTSTPTLFINGRIFVGARSYEELRRVIEEELAQSNGSK